MGRTPAPVAPESEAMRSARCPSPRRPSCHRARHQTPAAALPTALLVGAPPTASCISRAVTATVRILWATFSGLARSTVRLASRNARVARPVAEADRQPDVFGAAERIRRRPAGRFTLRTPTATSAFTRERSPGALALRQPAAYARDTTGPTPRDCRNFVEAVTSAPSDLAITRWATVRRSTPAFVLACALRRGRGGWLCPGSDCRPLLFRGGSSWLVLAQSASGQVKRQLLAPPHRASRPANTTHPRRRLLADRGRRQSWCPCGRSAPCRPAKPQARDWRNPQHPPTAAGCPSFGRRLYSQSTGRDT
jgi:hypothetical protein